MKRCVEWNVILKIFRKKHEILFVNENVYKSIEEIKELHKK